MDGDARSTYWKRREGTEDDGNGCSGTSGVDRPVILVFGPGEDLCLYFPMFISAQRNGLLFAAPRCH